jgi:hypothetical protein
MVAVDWNFSKGLPSGWTADADLPSLAFRSGSVRVGTGGGRYAYQLLAPVQRVPAGRYSILVAGRVMSGGIGLGLQDAATKRWISFRGYAGPTQGGHLALVADLPRAHRVRIVLTNFAQVQSQNSSWTVAHVALRAAPLPTRTVFAGAVPSGWSLAGGANAVSAGGLMHITTGAAPYSYALLSPSGYLAPGRHIVSAAVHVLVGGFGVGILDVRANRWLAYRNFSSTAGLQTERLPLTLPSGAAVHVVLTNFGDKVLRRSEWDLASVTVN